MKVVGWMLTGIGIVMIIIKGVSIPKKENIIDAGPIQVNKTEHKWYGWPTYAGGIIAVVGVALIATAKKKN